MFISRWIIGRQPRRRFTDRAKNRTFGLGSSAAVAHDAMNSFSLQCAGDLLRRYRAATDELYGVTMMTSSCSISLYWQNQEHGGTGAVGAGKTMRW